MLELITNFIHKKSIHYSILWNWTQFGNVTDQSALGIGHSCLTKVWAEHGRGVEYLVELRELRG